MRDIRLALRLLRRSPASTGIALASVALSVAATAVVFAAVKAVLLNPLPYADPARLVQLRSDYQHLQRQSSGDWVLKNDVLEVPRRTRTLQPFGVYGNALFNLAGDPGSTPEALYGVLMNSHLFATLGVSPMMGRNILPEEDQPEHSDVMILSYGLWVRRFHSDRSVIGRSVTVNGHSALVVGVMPPDFNFPLRRDAARTPSPYVEFWAAPLHWSSNPLAAVSAVARLRPGTSLAEARQDIASVSSALTRDFPAINRDRTLALNPLPDRAIGPASKALWLLMAASVLFMLIGCANVANLLLARGATRQREMAIRLALGAATSRIVRQLLTESCLLAMLGGLAGYLLTIQAWHLLPALAPASIPRLAAARADTAVFLFALVTAVLNGILFGFAPALRLAQTGSLGARGAAAGSRDGLRSWLVGSEVAFSVVLVVVGSQVLAGFVHLVAADPGFQQDRVLASVILPPPERYRDPQQRAVFYQRILDAVRAIPGVESAGTTDALPFSGENHGGYVAGGSPQRQLTAETDVIGGDYLQAMGVHLLEGRWLRPDEDAVIVSSRVARALWPDSSALDRRICVYCSPESPNNWKQVVGVVSDSSHSALNEPDTGSVYLAAGAMQRSVFLVARTARPTGEIARAIRGAVAAIDPNQPVFLSASMRELVADSVASRRFVMLLLAVTAMLALALAAAGIYGVVSYTTSRRTAEIGVRMALGATPARIVSLIFRQSFATVAGGLAVGLLSALAVTRVLRSVLAGLDGAHPGPIAVAAVLVAATAALACFIPARRATRTDPMACLRQD